jgi:hypothetical protein
LQQPKRPSPEKHFLAKLGFCFFLSLPLPFYPFQKDISAPQRNAQEKVFLAFVESEREDKRPRAHHIASVQKQEGSKKPSKQTRRDKKCFCINIARNISIFTEAKMLFSRSYSRSVFSLTFLGGRHLYHPRHGSQGASLHGSLM